MHSTQWTGICLTGASCGCRWRVTGGRRRRIVATDAPAVAVEATLATALDLVRVLADAAALVRTVSARQAAAAPAPTAKARGAGLTPDPRARRETTPSPGRGLNHKTLSKSQSSHH